MKLQQRKQWESRIFTHMAWNIVYVTKSRNASDSYHSRQIIAQECHASTRKGVPQGVLRITLCIFLKKFRVLQFGSWAEVRVT